MLLLDLYICCTNIKVGIGVINEKFRIMVTIDGAGAWGEREENVMGKNCSGAST